MQLPWEWMTATLTETRCHFPWTMCYSLRFQSWMFVVIRKWASPQHRRGTLLNMPEIHLHPQSAQVGPLHKVHRLSLGKI